VTDLEEGWEEETMAGKRAGRRRSGGNPGRGKIPGGTPKTFRGGKSRGAGARGRPAGKAPAEQTSRSGKKDTPKRREFPDIAAGKPPEQTRQPFEQEPQRRLGQYGRAGEPPLIKR
jgi:hypothetical protein